MPNRRQIKFIQELPKNDNNAESRPTKMAAGCFATGATLLVVPLCALLVIGPLFILPMWQGTQSARQPTIFDRAIAQLVGVSPTPTLSGVPIKLITTTPSVVATANNSATASANAPAPVTVAPTIVPSTTPQPSATPMPTATAELTPNPQPTLRPTLTRGPLTSARVVAVVNGDTIDVMISNTRWRVKYVGLSAPTGTQCFAANATNLNRQLVNGQTINLEQVGNNADAAGNLLRLVYLSNNKLVNEELLSRGAARVQTAALSDTLTARLTTAQQTAVTARAGLWAACGQARP